MGIDSIRGDIEKIDRFKLKDGPIKHPPIRIELCGNHERAQSNESILNAAKKLKESTDYKNIGISNDLIELTKWSKWLSGQVIETINTCINEHKHFLIMLYLYFKRASNIAGYLLLPELLIQFRLQFKLIIIISRSTSPK